MDGEGRSREGLASDHGDLLATTKASSWEGLAGGGATSGGVGGVLCASSGDGVFGAVNLEEGRDASSGVGGSAVTGSQQGGAGKTVVTEAGTGDGRGELFIGECAATVAEPDDLGELLVNGGAAIKTSFISGSSQTAPLAGGMFDRFGGAGDRGVMTGGAVLTVDEVGGEREAMSSGDGELILSPETAALLVGELNVDRALLGEEDVVATPAGEVAVASSLRGNVLVSSPVFGPCSYEGNEDDQCVSPIETDVLCSQQDDHDGLPLVAPELLSSVYEPESVELRLDAPLGGDGEASSVDREGIAEYCSSDDSRAESSSSSPGSSSNSLEKSSLSSYVASDEEVDILTVDGEEDGAVPGSEFVVGDKVEIEAGVGDVDVAASDGDVDVAASDGDGEIAADDGGGEVATDVGFSGVLVSTGDATVVSPGDVVLRDVDDANVVSRTNGVPAAKEDDVIVIDDYDEVFEEAVVADKSRRHGRGKNILVAAQVLNGGNLESSSQAPLEKEKPKMLILPLHPKVSYPSVATNDTLKWVAEHSCRNGVPEMRLPTAEERPWTTPPGWMCVYDAWFREYHLWFPLPELLLLYCARRQVSISQLCPVSIRNVVACLLLSAEAGVEMDVERFEQMVSFTRNSRTPGTFYVSMKGGLALVTETKSKNPDWIRNFFYVRSSRSSISDGRRIKTYWNQYHVGHVAGIQGWKLVDPEFKEDLEKIQSVGVQGWKIVDRKRIARNFVRIDKDPRSKRMGKVDMQFPDYYGSRYGGTSSEGQVAVPPPTTPAAPSVVVALPKAADAPALGRAGRVERNKNRGDGPSSVKKTASAAGKTVPPVRKANQSRKHSAEDRSTEDIPPPKVCRVASPPPAADEPPLYTIDFSYASSDRFTTDLDECARFCKMVHDQLADDLPAVEYDPELEELYRMFSRAHMKSLSFSNKMVLYTTHKLRLAREAWGEERDEEVKKLREDLEAEKQKVLVSQADVQRLSDKNVADAAAARKFLEEERDRLRHGRTKELKKYEGLSALYVARGRKMEKFVAEQPVIRNALFELNQVKGILGALRPLKEGGVLIPEDKIKAFEKDEIELDAKARALDVITFAEGELTRIPSFGPPSVPARPPSVSRSSTVAPARPSAFVPKPSAPVPKSSARPFVPRPPAPASARSSSPVPRPPAPARTRSSDGARDVDAVSTSTGATDPVVNGS